MSSLYTIPISPIIGPSTPQLEKQSQRSSKTLLELPVEVLVNIIRKIGINKFKLRQLSKYMKFVVDYSSLAYSIQSQYLPDKAEIAARFSNYQPPRIFINGKISIIGLKIILQYTPQLTTLSLAFCSDEHLRIISESGLKSSLQRLDISCGYDISNDSVKHLITLVHLQTFKLLNGISITDKAIPHFTTFIQNSRLKSLDLSGCFMISNHGLSYLQSYENLKELFLSCVNKRITLDFLLKKIPQMKWVQFPALNNLCQYFVGIVCF